MFSYPYSTIAIILEVIVLTLNRNYDVKFVKKFDASYEIFFNNF